jgi:hypothetical protein
VELDYQSGLFQNITLEIFMEWVEIDFPGSSEDKFTGTPKNYVKILLKNPGIPGKTGREYCENFGGDSRDFSVILEEFFDGKNWWILQETIKNLRGRRFALREEFVNLLMGGLSGVLKDGNFELLLGLLGALKQIVGKLTVEDTLAPLLVLFAYGSPDTKA